ncbi:MAG: motility protein A [Candidatus Anammoxibacter sp.]
MDLATIGGVAMGSVLIIVSILMGGSLGPFINIPSMMIVGGGTVAAVLIKYPMKSVLGLMPIIRKTMFMQKYSLTDEIERFSEFAKVAKREGLLALEQKCQDINEPYLTKALQLLVDGTSAEALRAVMEIEIDNIKERHTTSKGILESMGAAAPAFGMIGTLIGLITMLQQLDDPSTIGIGMATALITTFYGVLLANLLFLPLAGKLEGRSKEETTAKELMMEGVLSLQAGDSPYIVADKLQAFVARSSRDDDEDGGNKDKDKKAADKKEE